MNTTTAAKAAAQAGVTVRTVQAWCRTGAVAAVKQAGRWVIDTASLAYRIGLPALLKPARKAFTLTAKMVIALGGRSWIHPRTGEERVYLNDWKALAGLDVSYYGTGNVSGATLGGRPIANGRVAGIVGAIAKVWFDTADGLLHITGWDHDAVEVRYLDGQRDTINLAARIRAGILDAAAAP
jgi:hypothetical protein